MTTINSRRGEVVLPGQRRFDATHFPATVEQWLEVAHGEGAWAKRGVATTRLGLRRVLRTRREWRDTAEHNRPYLTSGGPRLGTTRIVWASGETDNLWDLWLHE